ncbi:winged helix-turn-helix transcriptional regulator [Streptosporangium sp. NPDC000396]|uniref:winged helix-turn-helix transcriptional regulator n=1 Tax=Streptosporangium sp. NPDC000396 TaxID=3366185 RepID=UPI003680439D
MARNSFAAMHCSIARTLAVAGEWWTPLILRDVFLGLRKFDDLTENLGISRNLLTERLTHLVKAGVLERVRYQDRPPRFEYHLTEAGRELVPALMTLMAWGDKWVTPPGGPPAELVHDTCGNHFTPTITCSECGGKVTATTVTPLAGPGAAEGPGTRLLTLGRQAPPDPDPEK